MLTQDRGILGEFYASLVQNFKDGVDEGELYMGTLPLAPLIQGCRQGRFYINSNGGH
jgi:hypothetical protein